MQLVMLTHHLLLRVHHACSGLTTCEQDCIFNSMNEAEASHRSVIVGIPAAETDSLTGTHSGLYLTSREDLC